MTQFMSRLIKQQPLEIYGDGEQSRDFIHVDDVVEAVTRILRTPNGTNGTYNLGSGRATTINQVAQILQHFFGDGEFKPIYAPARIGDIRQSQADIAKARKELGFEPLTSLDDGLERLVLSETNLLVGTVAQRTAEPPKVGNAGRH
jgi:nucleoside-diphosphate-sugar epimerase